MFSWPTILISILAACKEKLPIIIFGENGNFSASAAFAVLYRICQFFSKFYSTVFSNLLPIIVSEKNGLNQQSRFTGYAPVYHGILAIIIIITIEHLLAMWNIIIDDDMRIASIFFILSFIILGVVRSGTMWLDYNGDRSLLLVWATTRTFAYLLCFYFFNLSVAGVALCELISVTFNALIASFTDRRIWINKFQNYITCLLFLLINNYFISLVSNISFDSINLW